MFFVDLGDCYTNNYLIDCQICYKFDNAVLLLENSDLVEINVMSVMKKKGVNLVGDGMNCSLKTEWT